MDNGRDIVVIGENGDLHRRAYLSGHVVGRRELVKVNGGVITLGESAGCKREAASMESIERTKPTNGNARGHNLCSKCDEWRS